MSDNKEKIYIGVIGAGQCNHEQYQTALELGQEIARAGAILVCGGMDGVMKAAAEGCRITGGVSLGIIPGVEKQAANEFHDYIIATGFGEARNLVIIRTADVIIALPGKYGTLSEIGFALKMNKPVISLGSWDVSVSISPAETPKEAVQLALKAIQ